MRKVPLLHSRLVMLKGLFIQPRDQKLRWINAQVSPMTTLVISHSALNLTTDGCDDTIDAWEKTLPFDAESVELFKPSPHTLGGKSRPNRKEFRKTHVARNLCFPCRNRVFGAAPNISIRPGHGY